MIVHRYYLLTTVALLLISSSLSLAVSRLSAILAAHSDVKWDTKSAVVADVTCDGKLDTIVIGSKANVVLVGIAQSTAAKEKYNVTTVSFGVGNHAQDSFCAIPVRIKTYPLNCANELARCPAAKTSKVVMIFQLRMTLVILFIFIGITQKEN